MIALPKSVGEPQKKRREPHVAREPLFAHRGYRYSCDLRKHRRSKQFFGYGFISENITNMLKKAATPIAKAVSKAVGSKIGNKIANKIMRPTTLPLSPPSPGLLTTYGTVNTPTEKPSREQIFNSLNLIGNDDYN